MLEKQQRWESWSFCGVSDSECFYMNVGLCVCFHHRSVRFLMYSSVELSCSRSIKRAKVCLEAFTALPATASMCSAVSLPLREKKKRTEDKVKGGCVGREEEASNTE